MKYLTFLFTLLFILKVMPAQDTAISSKFIPLQGIQDIEIGIHAKVKIDCQGKEGLEIRGKQALLEKVDVKLESGRLTLKPKEWIEPGHEIYLAIGAPSLEFVQLNTDDEVRIEHIDQEEIAVMAINGTIYLEGQVERLNANGEIGSVDARELTAKLVHLNFWDAGSVVLGSPEKVTGKIRRSTQLSYENEPKEKLHTYSEMALRNKESKPESGKIKNPEARFIKFKLKNNSFNRIQCYVKGPKPNGGTFSYGFPMNPGQRKDKNWSIGSKVYRVNQMGMKKLLLEIKAEDEGEVVRMYPKEN